MEEANSQEKAGADEREIKKLSLTPHTVFSVDLIEIQNLNICSLNAKGRYAMTDAEIEGYRKQLNELTNQCSDKKRESHIQPQLQELARKVGASTMGVYLTGSTGSSIRDADTSELIRNIHQALQTASMVNMCRTATQGYETATKASNRASKQFWIFAGIAVFSALAAIVSAVAACVMAARTFAQLS